MQQVTEKISTIYNKLKELKAKGVRMKDIAEIIDFSPSVLSALFSTVFPIYIKEIEKAQGTESESLDHAISHVNNVSKKKLLLNLDRVFDILNTHNFSSPGSLSIPYLEQLIKDASHSRTTLKNKIDGIYMSYSQSSASHTTLKAEPFLLKTSEDGRNIITKRINASGVQHEGFAILKEHQALHILFNESHENYFAPVTIMIQLPFAEQYSMLKGIYMSLDEANNPIARRIVFMRISNDTSLDSFIETPHKSIKVSELDADMQYLADYLCTAQDAIKMYAIPSGGCNRETLIKEKEILAILN